MAIAPGRSFRPGAIVSYRTAVAGKRKEEDG